ACVTRTAEIGKSDTHPLFQSNVRVSHVTDDAEGRTHRRVHGHMVAAGAKKTQDKEQPLLPEVLIDEGDSVGS
ncbi:hypothetical protein JG687_00006065, partial [Phytophthora cactorum]